MTLNSSIVRKLEPSCEAAVVLCADARMFPLAFVTASRLVQLADGAYDVHLLTEPNVHIGRVPLDCPFGIELPAFRDHLSDRVRQNGFQTFCLLRLFASDLLSSRYRRILYLDSDIRVESSVAPLLQLELFGAPIAAVDDCTLPFFPSFKPGQDDRIRIRRREIGHSAADGYFNAGVMLIDAMAWRSEQTTRAALDLFERLKPLNANDQEMLNVLFRGRWTALSPRWNFTFFHDLGFESTLRPVVFHYAGAKPWQLRWDRSPSHLHAFSQMFADTPFADYRHPEPTKTDYWRALIKGIKWSLRNKRSIPRPKETERHIRTAHASQMREIYASYLIENIRTGRFLDVRAGITALEESGLGEVSRHAHLF